MGFTIGLVFAIAYLIQSTIFIYLVFQMRFYLDLWENIVSVGLVNIAIGSISGLLIGLLVSWTAKSYTRASRIGGWITGVLCFPWFYVGAVMWLMSPTGFFILPTCLAYIFVGSWMGQRIYRRLDAQTSHNNDIVSPLPIYPYVRNVIRFVGIISVLFIAMHAGLGYIGASQGMIMEKYPMFWKLESNSRCDTRVILDFEQAPGYYIYTCSESLYTALMQTNVNPVEVVFERNFVAGVWEYNVSQVGAWKDKAEFDGISLTCPSVWSEEKQAHVMNCTTNEPPLKNPLRWKQ